ncbi:hypothetical protein RFI_05361 [Reticulomyxa filosa]|uniref:Uncharacterized protein n=1 Tax=Reticulomyxa filosa TaxID=46433 RepID=X6P100_RETFI|nr:hypothetical protein RFI_05361 [Reticulomyxa filosa]|eukprot:ETO31759.1 hypothetical protein RFI_05361 [Reticulomyxa filosa]
MEKMKTSEVKSVVKEEPTTNEKKKQANRKKKGMTLSERKLYRDIIINTGGSIMSFDFCPCSDHHSHSYLAVMADHKRMYHYFSDHQSQTRNANTTANTNTSTNRNSSDKIVHSSCLIQIWRIKKYKPDEPNPQKSKHDNIKTRDDLKKQSEDAQLCYCIVHPSEFVCDLQWFPKCNSASPDHIGILAVAGSDGYLYVYSVPLSHQHDICSFNTTSSTNSTSTCALVWLKPILILGVPGRRVSRCKWSTNSRYPIILAGTLEGEVIVWNMKQLTSSLVDATDSKPRTNEHLTCFSAHHKTNAPVVSIDWYEDGSDGVFIVATNDGQITIWDINRLCVPIFKRKFLKLSQS